MRWLCGRCLAHRASHLFVSRSSGVAFRQPRLYSFGLNRAGRVSNRLPTRGKKTVMHRLDAAVTQSRRRSRDFDDYGDVDAMFVRLGRAGTDEERRQWCNRIVARCLPLADHIAYKFVGKG